MRDPIAWLAALLFACAPSPASGPADSGAGGEGGDGGPLSGGGLSIGAIVPNHGPLAGDTSVAMTGHGFADGIAVAFGGRPGTGLHFLSATQLTVVTPAGAAGGPVDVTVTLGTETATAAKAFTYDVVQPVDWCVLQFPKALDAAPDSPAGPVYGRVLVTGVTGAGGDPSALSAQVGFGPSGSTPDSTWSWFPATYNASCGGCGNNDEFQGNIMTAAAGSFALAVRFSTDQGATWTPCDAKGDTPQSPYDPANQGTLAVAALDGGADAGPFIGGCDLQAPVMVDVAPGVTTPEIFGRVWAPGITGPGGGTPALITAEVGYGPTGADPGADGGWSWFSATYNASCQNCGNNYEYEGSFPAPGPGSYALAYRFSLDGVHFRDCDTKWDTPYNPSNAGVLTVEVDAGVPGGGEDAGHRIGGCDLQSPPSLTVTSGTATPAIYGQVWVPGLTGPGGGDPSLIDAEVGYGPAGSNPGGDAGWSFFPAAYNARCADCGNNYEYDGTFTAPAPGTYALVTRFSLDGVDWVDCDTKWDWPYEPANAGVLTVEAPDAGRIEDAGVDAGVDAGSEEIDAGGDAGATVAVDNCDLQFPHSLDLEPGGTSTVYAQVLSNGVTSVAGNQGDFEVEVGYGPAGSDPATGGWTWFTAAFNAGCQGCGSNYEYGGTLTAPAAGTYALAARVSGDHGATWRDCDTAWDPTYLPANAGTLAVAWVKVDNCWLQWPYAITAAAGADAGLVYGHVQMAGVTDSAGNQGRILAEVGVGPVGADPTDPDAGWTWSPAQFNASCSTCSGNPPAYEYQGPITAPSEAGEYDFLPRFSADDGGYWTACGRTGPWSPDGGNDAGVLVVQ